MNERDAEELTSESCPPLRLQFDPKGSKETEGHWSLFSIAFHSPWFYREFQRCTSQRYLKKTKRVSTYKKNQI